MSAIETLTRALEAAPDVCLAVLFGSTARGTARPDSDLDVGVLLHATALVGAESELTVTLERATGRTVDLVRLDNAPALLRFEIAREGQVLIEREAGSWTHFKARAMVDWWDWAPTARMMHKIVAARLRDKVARGQA